MLSVNLTANTSLRFTVIDEGLPHLAIANGGDMIVRDAMGFVWVGTQGGLGRYDDSSFKNYQYNTEDEKTLSSSAIQEVYLDSQSALWVATINGLNKYDAKLDVFIRVSLGNDLDIFAIAEKDENNLWLGTTEGLYRLNKKSGEYVSFHSSTTDSNMNDNTVRRSILDLYDDHHGSLWVGTTKGVEHFDIENKTFTPYLFKRGEETQNKEYGVNKIFKDKDDVLWLATTGGLAAYNRESDEFVFKYNEYLQRDNTPFDVTDIAEDENGYLWVGLYGHGLVRLDREKDRLDTFIHNDTDPNSLSNDFVLDLYLEPNGLLWAGTKKGLNFIHSNHSVFQFNTLELQQGDQKNIKPVATILSDNQNNLWLGTYGTGLIKQTFDGDKAALLSPKKYDTNSNIIASTFLDSNNNIWVSEFNVGLSNWNQDTESFQLIKSPKTIRTIAQDKEGRLWVGDHKDGIYFWEGETGDFVREPRIVDEKIANDTIASIIIDNENVLWAASSKHGLLSFNIDNGDLVTFSHQKDNKKSLSNNEVIHIYQDSFSDIWIGTASGLNKFDKDANIMTRYTMEDGLPSNLIGGVIEGKPGMLWIMTGQGITLLDKKTNKLTTFQPEDGLPKITIVRNAIAKNPQTGELFFGTFDGYLQFQPDDLILTQDKPSLLITDFRLYNKTVGIGEDRFNMGPYLDKSIMLTPAIQLDHKTKHFSFGFSAVGAIKPENVNYYYKLEGWDDEWIKADNTTKLANYINIPAGNYRFEVRAVDTDGFWEDVNTEIQLRIKPHPFMTWWALAFYFVAFLILLWLVILNRTRLLKQRAEWLEGEVTLRTKEIQSQKETIERLLKKKDDLFANVSHEFRTPLTLVIGPIGKIIKETRNKSLKDSLTTVLMNARRLLRMVDQLLDLARLEHKSDIEKEVIDASSLVHQIVLQFSSAFDDKSIRLEEDIEDQLYIKISSDSFEKIVVNLVSNAIKFSSIDTAISVKLYKKNECVVLSVKDNGIGFDEKDKGKIFERFTRLSFAERYQGFGIGLALAKEITEYYNGRIEAKSQIGKGAEFILSLPKAEPELASTELMPQHEEYRNRTELYPHYDIISQTRVEPHTNIQQNTVAHQNTVLIIEDNADMRRFIVDGLSHRYSCVTAEDGIKGIETAIELVPDLIITDLMMPRKDGFEVTEVIRNDSRTSHIPIIMLTARTDIETRKFAWKSDIDEFFEKPFSSDELILRAENLLNIRQILSERVNQSLANNDDSSIQRLNTKDREFIDKFRNLIAENYNEDNLNLGLLCDQLAMSERQMQRKIKAVLNQTATEYIRNYRLQQGALLLKNGLTISEVTYQVGFSATTYFSSCFKAYYGVSPTTYQQKTANA